jgi:hypothetical protein
MCKAHLNQNKLGKELIKGAKKKIKGELTPLNNPWPPRTLHLGPYPHVQYEISLAALPLIVLGSLNINIISMWMI